MLFVHCSEKDTTDTRLLCLSKDIWKIHCWKIDHHYHRKYPSYSEYKSRLAVSSQQGLLLIEIVCTPIIFQSTYQKIEMTEVDRRSRLEVFCKKGISKNFAKFTKNLKKNPRKVNWEKSIQKKKKSKFSIEKIEHRNINFRTVHCYCYICNLLIFISCNNSLS